MISEREHFLDTLAAAESRAEPVVLATVVGADGSVYRRIGARMLIAGDGTRVGAISGGCLEAEVVHRAGVVLRSGETAVETYDTRDPLDATWGSGVGCQGVVDVLLEPVAPERLAETLALHRRLLLPERRMVLATLVRGPGPAPVGARLLVDETGVEALGGGAVDAGWDPVVADARALLAGGRSQQRVYPGALGEWRVALEILEPPVRLLVIGGGDDAVPVTAFARALGWRVEVVDHRTAFAVPERFPAAERVIRSEPEKLAEHLDLDERTAVVVMTHSFPRDRIYLEAILESSLRYVALLGPRARTELLLGELAAAGKTYPEETLARIHGPAGLDLGGETPEAIALAIVGEAQAVLAGRSGAPLRDRGGPIHPSADVPPLPDHPVTSISCG